jgi:copper(I)-binding protein
MIFSRTYGFGARISIPLLALTLFAAGFALPKSGVAADNAIHLDDAKARPTLPNAPSAVVYLTITNTGSDDDTLASVVASVADTATVHRTENDNGIISMKTVRDLQIKAGETVRLAPDGLHIMLTGLKRQLKTGETFPVTLTFIKAGPVTVSVSVGPIAPPAHDTPSMPGMKM